jgi:hypothetical protein
VFAHPAALDIGQVAREFAGIVVWDHNRPAAFGVGGQKFLVRGIRFPEKIADIIKADEVDITFNDTVGQVHS